MRDVLGTRWPAALVALAVSTTLLAACGGASGNGGSAACTKGAAGSGPGLAVAAEPAAGVATPTAKCWASIKPTTMGVTDTGTLPKGASATFKVAWSPKNLYISAWTATWPLYNAGSPESSNWWESDTTEFTVSGTDGHTGPYSSGHTYQLAVVEDGSLQTSGDNGANASPMPTGLAKIVSGKGFYTELIVPWATLGVSAPAKGQKYQFDIGQDFGNSSGQRVAQMVWQANPADAGTANDWHQDTHDWGTITLA